MREGKGEGQAHWRYERFAGDLVCVLRIQVSRPVSASFDIPLAMPIGQRVLEGITSGRELFLCFGNYPGPFDPQDENSVQALVDLITLPSPDVIAIEIDTLARNA